MIKFHSKKTLYALLALAFWLFIWEVLARNLDADFIFPTVGATLHALFSLLGTAIFYKSVAFSLLRVLLGFIFGLVFGAALALLAHYIPLLDALISPMMSVVKATPVASFIMVLWCFIGASPVPIVIGALMVSPLIYHNLRNALKAENRELLEICEIYAVKGRKRFCYLYLPVLLEFLIPATVAGMGLCWKASVAAEIIAYTKNSIGREIYLSKAFLEGADLFAYTLIVILLSLFFERITHFLGEAVKKKCHLN